MEFERIKILLEAVEAYSHERPWLAYAFMAIVMFALLAKAYRWIFPKGAKERELFSKCLRRQTPLLSPKETREYRRLAEYVAMASFKVFPKMRFEDVFDYRQDCSEIGKARGFLSQKKIDFVLVDAYGYVHACIDIGRPRDEIKEYACEAVGIRYVSMKVGEPFGFLDDSCLSSGIMMHSPKAAAAFVVGKH